MHYARLGWFVALGLLSAGCGRAAEVTAGMTSAEVVSQLGEPDRMQVLRGKLLEEVTDRSQVERTDARVLFVYERHNLRLWMVHGRVQQVLRGNTDVPQNTSDESPPHSQGN